VKGKLLKKIVVYSPFEDNPNIYNLALADAFDDGTFSDKIVSNNNDLEKIMSTVVQTVFCFFEKNPTKFIYIEGNTLEKNRLYRIIISKELELIESIFFVNGINNSIPKKFQKNKNYQAFVISLKSQENLSKLQYESSRT
jgi:hypothetical protein